jgi:phosphoribosyl-AMP cyclohydrolase
LAKLYSQKKKKNFMKFDDKGLIPCIIQDETSKKVLMLGYANEEAVRLTKETKFVHFWSRSRKKLWKKGGTSGKLLLVKEIFLDCDEDAILIMVETFWPTCHTNKQSCFDQDEKTCLSHVFHARGSTWTEAACDNTAISMEDTQKRHGTFEKNEVTCKKCIEILESEET